MFKRRKLVALVLAFVVLIVLPGGFFLHRMLVAPVTPGEYGIPSECEVEVSRDFATSLHGDQPIYFGFEGAFHHYQRVVCDVDPKAVRASLEAYARRHTDEDLAVTTRVDVGRSGGYRDVVKTLFLAPPMTALPETEVWYLEYAYGSGHPISVCVYRRGQKCVIEVMEIKLVQYDPD